MGKLLRSTALCTATLVGSRTVITAAHCVDPTSGAWHRFVAGGSYNSVASVTRHPDYDEQTIKNDIAIVTLSYSPGITPSLISKSPPKVGQELTIVGFGRTQESGPSDSGIKRVAKNKVSSLEPTRIKIWGSSNGAGNICNGDSGGPSFATLDGQEVQVGVHSVKFGSCGYGGGDTRVDAFLSWIVQASGGDVEVGPLPPEPDPNKPDPNKPDPNKPDPNKPDPNKPDPNKPDPPPADADGDGVPDADDLCSQTPAGAKPWAAGTQYAGCAGGQYKDAQDADRDGIPNGQDGCANTPIGAKIWTSGYWKGCAGGQLRDR